MSNKKYTHEAGKAFRSSDKTPLTEHEEKQKALLKNLTRLRLRPTRHVKKVAPIGGS
jgi:hypothetical protein